MDLHFHSLVSLIHLKCVLMCVMLVVVGACYIGQHEPCRLPVEATVTEVDRAINPVYGTIESRVTVEYGVDDETYSCVLATSTAENIFKGDSLPVVCDPDHPEVAILEPVISGYVMGWIMVTAGLALLVSQAL